MANPLNASNSTNSNTSSKLSSKIKTNLPETIEHASPIDDGDNNHHNAEIRDNSLVNTPSQPTQPSNDHYIDDEVLTPTIYHESSNSANEASPNDSSSDNSSIGPILNANDITTSASSSRSIESRLNLILSGLPEHDDDDNDEEEEEDEDDEKNEDIFCIFNNEDRYTVDWSDEDQQNVSPQIIHGFGNSADAHLSLQPPFTEEYEMMHVMSTMRGPSRPNTAQNSPRSNGYDSESSIGAIVMGVCVTGNVSMQHPASTVYISGQSDPMTSDEDEEDDDYA